MQSHHCLRYTSTERDRDTGEQWAESTKTSHIHDARLPTSNNSVRWKKGYKKCLIGASASTKDV